MKVAYILPSFLQPSGWRSHACAFLAEIKSYVEPVLFVAENEVDEARRLFASDPVFSLAATQQVSLSSYQGVRKLFASYRQIRKGGYPRVDLVHALEAYPSGLVGMWLAHKMQCPYILTSHGTYSVLWYERPVDRLMYQRVLSDANLVCPVSNGTADIMRQYFGRYLAGGRLLPIFNGNDFYKDIPGQGALNRETPAIPTLLTVGDVKPRKGHHISLAAFAKVKAQIPAARYWIVGQYSRDDYYQGLLNFIRDNGLQDVEFLGVVSDEELRRRYLESSVFILTPQQEGLKFEGFGLVYLEAGAYGLAVVATRSGGVPDAVRDGETGYLAGEEDIDALAGALVALLSDPELARQMGRNNRRWAETLTWERTAGGYLQAYRDVLGMR